MRLVACDGAASKVDSAILKAVVCATRLTPSHAVQGNRRYRYYVSRSLMSGTAGQGAQGWRIPAPELERNLAAALAGILDDRAAFVHDLDRNLDAAKIQSILATAARWAARLRSDDESANALASLIDRAEVAIDGIRLSIRMPSESDQSPNALSTLLSFKRYVPLLVRRRGIEMRLVVGGGPTPKVDSPILKAVARANQWLTELLSGRSSSLVDIGRREGVSKRDVNRIIRLAFLAPSIIEEIARGHQPPELTAQVLSTRRGDLPLRWQAQRELLGFGSPLSSIARAPALFPLSASSRIRQTAEASASHQSRKSTAISAERDNSAESPTFAE